jgi:ring-1,2-phenylacetyl-CoA epoxidase subunit PaaE
MMTTESVDPTPQPTKVNNLRFKKGWMPLRINRIVSETHDCKTLFFDDADDGGRAFDYKAGQYLTFRFDGLTARPLVRSYTMSSSPCEPQDIAVTVKIVDNGIVSNYLCSQTKVGDVLRARGPIGKFIYDPQKDQKHLVMIAAGSGVTPFVSILREYADRLGSVGCPQSMTLLVSYRSKEDLILWEILQELNAKPGINVFTTLTRENDAAFWYGRISPELLERSVDGQYQERTYMLCGPEAMMQTGKEHLSKFVDAENIKMESFENT